MKVTLFKDVARYALTSTLTKENIDLVKKYRPDALKVKDADGNDVFGISYVEGKNCIAKNGITFGATSHDGGFAMVVGDLPETLPAGTPNVNEYVADIVGSALGYLESLENTLPSIAEGIACDRAALIDSIVEA